jgi:hypothetical protein
MHELHTRLCNDVAFSAGNIGAIEHDCADSRRQYAHQTALRTRVARYWSIFKA